MTADRVIEVSGLTKRFGQLTALDELSFTVRPGHVTGFLGPNGAGKTTTMRVILGLDAATSGTATVGGCRYAGLVRPLREVGSLLDATAVHGGRTAWSHLAALAQSNGIGQDRVGEVLELTGLQRVAHGRLRAFSLGMKQRLGIAAALLGDPPVLLFDEPVNGLDPEGVRWIRALFRTLAAEGRTVFVSSHLMSEMAMTADHLIIIGRGALIADLPTEQFIEANARRDVLVRSPRAGDLAALLAAAGATVSAGADGGLAVTAMDAPAIADLAAARGIPVHELTPRLASLEDAYLDITGGSVEFRAEAGPGVAGGLSRPGRTGVAGVAARVAGGSPQPGRTGVAGVAGVAGGTGVASMASRIGGTGGTVERGVAGGPLAGGARATGAGDGEVAGVAAGSGRAGEVAAGGSARPSGRPAAAVAVRAGDVLRSEWTKLRAVRSNGWTLLIAAIATVGAAALVAQTFAMSPALPSGGPIDTLTLSFLGYAEYGVLPVVVLSVLTFTSEFSTGLIRTTLVAEPRRWAVLAAKAAVAGAAALVAGEVLCLASFLLAQAILAGHGRGLSLFAPGVAVHVLAAGLLMAVCTMIGVALGAITRHTAGAIAASIGVIYLLAVLCLILPAPWKDRLGRFTLADAAYQVVTAHPQPGLLSPALSLLVLLAWLALALGAAVVALVARDV